MSHDTHSENNKSPEQLEEEISATRSSLDSTLEEIGERLSPGQLVDQSLDYIKGSMFAPGTRTFFQNLGASVRDNPLSLLVTGAGLAWMMSSDGNRYRGESSAKRKGAELAGSASQSYSSAVSRADDSAQSLKEGMRETNDEIQHMFRRGGQSFQAGWERLVNEQPLVLGLVGATVGALIAGSLPPTRKEDESLGQTRDDLLQRASEETQKRAEDIEAGAREKQNQAGDDELKWSGDSGQAVHLNVPGNSVHNT